MVCIVAVKVLGEKINAQALGIFASPFKRAYTRPLRIFTFPIHTRSVVFTLGLTHSQSLFSLSSSFQRCLTRWACPALAAQLLLTRLPLPLSFLPTEPLLLLFIAPRSTLSLAVLPTLPIALLVQLPFTPLYIHFRPMSANLLLLQ